MDIRLGLFGVVSKHVTENEGGQGSYLVLSLVELVTDGITSSLESGSDGSITILGDLLMFVSTEGGFDKY